MCARRAMFKVHGMVSVEIVSDWYAIRISRPQGEGGVVGGEMERIRVFAEAIDIRVGW